MKKYAHHIHLNKLTSKKDGLFIIFGFVLVVIALSYVRSDSRVINKTDVGFSPGELTVQRGDTVMFRNDTERPFWPASNLHPSHEMYPAFDAGTGIESEWSFTFDQSGVWPFHDHLDPKARGIIIVEDPDRKQIVNVCGDVSSSDLSCIEDELRKKIRSEGVQEGIEFIEHLYLQNDIAAQSCHSLVHVLGEEVFTRFVRGEKPQISGTLSLCNFGFYHGFMESLFVGGDDDVQEAAAFCAYVDRVASDQSRDSGSQCFHGIGHGVVGSHDPALWGDEEALIDQALPQCELIGDTQDHLYRCVSGVYNGIANYYLSGEFALKPREEDPLWVCSNQPHEYQDACYGNMMPFLLVFYDNDARLALPEVMRVVPPALQKSVLDYFFGIYATTQVTVDSHSDLVELCRELEEGYSSVCIEGYAGGLFDNGVPGREYETVVRFCDGLSVDAEKRSCYDSLVARMAQTYSEDRFHALYEELAIDQWR